MNGWLSECLNGVPYRKKALRRLREPPKLPSRASSPRYQSRRRCSQTLDALRGSSRPPRPRVAWTFHESRSGACARSRGTLRVWLSFPWGGRWAWGQVSRERPKRARDPRAQARAVVARTVLEFRSAEAGRGDSGGLGRARRALLGLPG